MVNHAINRKNKGKKHDKTITAILELLSSASRPLATQEIAEEINSSWHSVQTRCLRLQLEEKIVGMRVGRINLWMIKKDG